MENIQRFVLSVFLIGISSMCFAQENIWLEAETGAEYDPIIVKSDSSASQEIFLASKDWSHTGRIDFNVTIETAGVYHLWARLKMPWEGMIPYRISVDGGTQVEWAADTRPLTQLQQWNWANSFFTVSLMPGDHVISLYNNQGGPNLHIDKILITDDSNFTPTGAGGAEEVSGTANTFRSTVVDDYGQLSVQGSQLVDKNGQPVQLQGVSTHGLQWFPLVEGQTVPNVAEFFGAEVIRLAMYVEATAPNNSNDFWNGYMADPVGMKARTKQAIDEAIAAGIYVIVDWHIHNIPGDFVTEATDFFKEIALEYGSYPNIIYEIANEPLSAAPWPHIKTYAETVIPEIRAYDPDNVIIVGTSTWSQDIHQAAADPLSFTNIMYAFHYYAGTHNFTDMSNRVTAALNSGIAIFVSEWGTSNVTTNGSNFPVAKQWLDFMNAKKLSWANWSLGDKDETSSLLKPDAGMSGPWTDADLTESGIELKPYFDAPKPSCSGNICPNVLPLALSQLVTAELNTNKAIILKGKDFDGTVSSFIIDTAPLHGSVSLNGSSAIYTPANGYLGDDEFTIVAIDNEGGLSLPAKIYIEVNEPCGISCIPVADNKSVATTDGVGIDIVLSGSDSNGIIASYQMVSPPTNGVLLLDGSTATYNPSSGFVGNDSFTYAVVDNDGEVSSPATVTVQVKPDPLSLLSCDMVSEDEWVDGFTVYFSLTNNGTEAINAWQLTIDLGAGESYVDGWSAAFTGSSGSLSVENLAWNGTLQPGQSTSFGFSGAHSGVHQTPVCH